MKTLLPTATTFVRPGKDNPQGGIVATFTSWGSQWAWEVQYHLTSDPWFTQHIVVNTSAILQDETIDLRED